MKLFVSDLDGTLLDRNFRISKQNLKGLKRLEQNKIQLAIASGRIYNDILEICKEYELHPYIISNNGACIFNPGNDLIYGKWMIPSQVKEIAAYLDSKSMCYGLGTSREFVVRNTWEENLEAEISNLKNKGIYIPRERVNFAKYELLSQNGVKEVESFQQFEQEQKPCYSISLVTYDQHAMRDIQQFLRSYPNLTTSIAGSHSMEIMSVKGSKNIAVEFLSDYLNITMDEVGAIGDGLNDLDMIATAGTGIAVGNAREEVKEHSNYVTTHCLDDGVAKAIEWIIGGKK